MNRRLISGALLAVACGLTALSSPLQAQVTNLKVVTDASPDYSDLDSLAHSITSNWQTDEEKMWALFYWNHIARRQTNPMTIHGKAETDPIRQFNDYGFTMCSTISGIECAIWAHMGYPVKYYDIAVHTVAEVQYGGKYHLYDGSLSSYYTLCDGKTVAGVEDVGKTLGCEASGGKQEAGHIAMYHCVNGTGPDGFLEGADTIRDLRHLGDHTFQPGALKHRTYYNDAERMHRYILNLKDNEVYTRSYVRLDKVEEAKEFTSDPAYFTPNGTNKDGSPKDPEAKNPRYRIRGNGAWTFTPELTQASLANAVHSSTNVKVAAPSGLQPGAAGQPAEAIFKIDGANVITSMKIAADLSKKGADDVAAISISRDNGINWTEVYKAETAGSAPSDVKLIEQVNGAYEVLVKVQMQAKSSPADVQLKSIKIDTITQINSKTQPKLNLGKNTVYVGAGAQEGSIVLWPELQGDKYKPMVFQEENVKTKPEHEGWNAVMHPATKGGEGFVVFKVDAPQDLTKIIQYGRMYVRNKNAEIRFEHSFDGGKTWTKSYSHTEIEQPWDDIHQQVTTEIPTGTKSVLFKYVLKNAGLYSIRMEANHKVADPAAKPIEVTFNWSERQEDYSQVKRSHTQIVEKLPATYEINVGGFDHPVVESLTINTRGARPGVKYGYSDGKDVGGEKFVGTWVTYGKNLAQGKPYTLSVPPAKNDWGAGDPDLKALTDGRVGSNYTGGASYKEGPLWEKGQNPEIVVDLGAPVQAGLFRVHLNGYPWHDSLKGQVKDEVEVLTSLDGQTFTPAGKFDFRLYWKDLPLNFMWPDDEQLPAYNHTLLLDKPIEARYVKFATKSARKMVISEVQVVDKIETKPFDLKIALPKGKE